MRQINSKCFIIFLLLFILRSLIFANTILSKKELKKLDSFTLSDIIEIRTKAGKTTEELEIENIFMRYYLRQYRSK